MKHIITIITILVLTTSAAHPQQSRGLSFSGVFESSIQTNIAKDNDDGNRGGGVFNATYGLEQYANIRMQSRIGDDAAFFGAVNFIAATGDYALRSMAMSVDIDSGKNYVAEIELERLYFKLKRERIDIDAGLMRMPFGYGLAFRPLDFLSEINPLKPDARPRAVVGGNVTYYPMEELKLQAFATTGREPFSNDGGIAGLSLDRHLSRGSVQLLYALEHSNRFPASDPNFWTHRAGVSVKADIEAGFALEALYAYNQQIEREIDGLSLSAGFDYSLLRGNLIILTEYLYNGASSSTSILTGGNFANEHYICFGATWRFSDFTNAMITLVADIDDGAVIPMLTFNHEMFQGVTLALMAQAPDFERHYLFEGKVRLRF